MAASLIQHGAIRTTATKAKELRGFVERLITIARRNTLHARRQVIAALQDRYMTDDEGEFLDQTVVQKLFSEVAPKYASRPGGYTRIIHLSDRRIGDAGRQVLLQLVEETVLSDPRYVARLERHYHLVKEAASDPNHPAYDKLQKVAQAAKPVRCVSVTRRRSAWLRVRHVPIHLQQGEKCDILCFKTT